MLPDRNRVLAIEILRAVTIDSVKRTPKMASRGTLAYFGRDDTSTKAT